MKKYQKISLALSAGAMTLMLAGCSGSSPLGLIGAPEDSAVQLNNQHFTPTTPNNVTIYAQGQTPKCKYVTIGSASVDNTQWFISRSLEKKYKILKEQASKMGGSGVINITQNFANTDASIIRCVS
jgi:hypothetical protein